MVFKIIISYEIPMVRGPGSPLGPRRHAASEAKIDERRKRSSPVWRSGRVVTVKSLREPKKAQLDLWDLN